MTGATVAENEYCQVCLLEMSRTEHRQAEIVGQLNHAFSIDGTLKSSEPPRQKPETGQRVIVANAIDVQLRDLLITKGVLTVEDFEPPRSSSAIPE